MRSCSCRRSLIGGLAVGLMLPVLASAQYRPVPNPGADQPPAQTQAYVGSVNVNQSPYVNNGYPGYYPPYYQTPMNGYLTGAADVIGAQGQFLVSKRQSQVIEQQAKQAQLDTQKQAYQQWQWEQAQAPKLQDIREQNFATGMQRARNNPPPTDIWSGWALNTLLAGIQRDEAVDGVRGPTLPLDQNLLKSINVTTGTTATTQGSVGMFKNGKLEWPTSLTDSRFNQDRENVDRLLSDLVKQVMESGRAGGDAVNSLRSAVDGLRSHLKDEVAEMSADDYLHGVRYVNELRQGISQLAAPNAVNYLNGTWQAKGQTIGELVDNMTRQGVKFAPATPGNENVYTALYSSMLAYDSGLARMTRRGGPSSFATGGPGQGPGPGGP